MNWISEHSSVLNVFINGAMLVVWITYLHLGLVAYLRQRKPRIVINRGSGTDTDCLCFVSNLSQEPIYVQSVYATVNTTCGAFSITVTDRELLQRSGSERRPEEVRSQGPLRQGDFMSLGTFRNIIKVVERDTDLRSKTESELGEVIQSVDVMVVAAFGGDDLEIAARREYRVSTDQDPWKVVPVGPATKQISRGRDRKQIREMIQENLEKEA